MGATIPYDLSDLQRFTPADFEFLSVRTVNDFVVVYDKKSGQAVSIPLAEWEADALGRWLITRWPQEHCDKHRQYKRGRRFYFDSFADCRCALLFLNSLLYAWLHARRNRLAAGSGMTRLAAQEVLDELRATQ